MYIESRTVWIEETSIPGTNTMEVVRSLQKVKF